MVGRPQKARQGLPGWKEAGLRCADLSADVAETDTPEPLLNGAGRPTETHTRGEEGAKPGSSHISVSGCVMCSRSQPLDEGTGVALHVGGHPRKHEGGGRKGRQVMQASVSRWLLSAAGFGPAGIDWNPVWISHRLVPPNGRRLFLVV